MRLNVTFIGTTPSNELVIVYEHPVAAKPDGLVGSIRLEDGSVIRISEKRAIKYLPDELPSRIDPTWVATPEWVLERCQEHYEQGLMLTNAVREVVALARGGTLSCEVAGK